MHASDFDKFVQSLDSFRPLRVVRLSNKSIASVEARQCDGKWEHICTVPNGPIYKYRHEDYRDKQIDTSHASIMTLYNKLRGLGYIKQKDKHNFTAV